MQFEEPLSWVQDHPQGHFTQIFLHLFCLVIQTQFKQDFHWTGPIFDQGLHVHHLLQPVQGQPTSQVLLRLDSSYCARFFLWQTHRSHAHIEGMSLHHSHCTHALPTSSVHQQFSLWHSWWQLPFTGLCPSPCHFQFL
jgi:hypothetical protein